MAWIRDQSVCVLMLQEFQTHGTGCDRDEEDNLWVVSGAKGRKCTCIVVRPPYSHFVVGVDHGVMGTTRIQLRGCATSTTCRS
jgi:hypothetical protein